MDLSIYTSWDGLQLDTNMWNIPVSKNIHNNNII